jgi:hypothetical protein
MLIKIKEDWAKTKLYQEFSFERHFANWNSLSSKFDEFKQGNILYKPHTPYTPPPPVHQTDTSV